MDRSQQPPEQPTPAPLAPQPNRILAEPATVELAQQDYANAADVRHRMDQQDARNH